VAARPVGSGRNHHHNRIRADPQTCARPVKTASSGSFGFQGPGSHLIGSIQQSWLSIGGWGGRQVGLEIIALTASTSSVFPAEVDVGQSAHDTYPTGEMPLSPLPV